MLCLSVKGNFTFMSPGSYQKLLDISNGDLAIKIIWEPLKADVYVWKNKNRIVLQMSLFFFYWPVIFWHILWIFATSNLNESFKLGLLWRPSQ